MTVMKDTPFTPRTEALSYTDACYRWGPWHLPTAYTTMEMELEAIRTRAAVIDMSPLSKCSISGSDAVQFVDKIITRDATKIGPDQLIYTPWCDERGKVMGDNIVARTETSTFMFSSDPNLRWFAKHAEGLDVTVADQTEEYGILALQGPASRQVLEAATGQDWSDLAFSRRRNTVIDGIPLDVWRTGFSGELGYELWVTVEGAVPMLDAVLKAGERFGLVLAGGHAIKVARVEAGLILISGDYTGSGGEERGAHTEVDPEEVSSPFELGLGRLVDFDKTAFIGRQALVEEQARGGPPRLLVGLDIDWRQIVARSVDRGVAPNVSPRVLWGSLPLRINGKLAGRASSVTWAPSVRKLIAFGHVPKEHAASGFEVTIDWTEDGTEPEEVDAVVVDLPFLPRNRSRSAPH